MPHLETFVMKNLTRRRVLQSAAALNGFRRQLGQVFTRCDLWMTPTTPFAASDESLLSACFCSRSYGEMVSRSCCFITAIR